MSVINSSQLLLFFGVIFTKKRCFYHVTYFWVYSSLSMTSKPNLDRDAGRAARHPLSQVTDSLFTQQPHHACYSGTCISKITCDRLLRLFTHNSNQGNKILNGQGVLRSTLLRVQRHCSGTPECVELFAPASYGTNCYIFSILIFSFSVCTLARQLFLFALHTLSSFCFHSDFIICNLLWVWRSDHKECYNYICMKSC